MTANNIYTIAGSTQGDVSGALVTSKLNFPYGICVDTLGNVYITDTGNNKIKFIPIISNTYFGQVMTANNIYTIAGSGSTQEGTSSGDTIGLLSTSKFNGPYGISLDRLGNVYIIDYNNHKIKFIPVISNTYFGQVMTSDSIYTIAGSTQGDINGFLSTSRLYNAWGIWVDTLGNVYITDYNNHKIKKILTNQYYNTTFTRLNSGYKVNNNDALYYNEGIISLSPQDI